MINTRGYDKDDLTAAVENFTFLHDTHQLGEGKTYRQLIPKKAPGPGEQYAFEVDLDKCTGCKACVTACHSENGLEVEETWRSVGLVQGGTSENPAIQHITTACHHCADPACMNGCPTKAYVKDKDTGIVKHLEDQCFGCQYCILKCPYDVPKYSRKKGIVHKCDMCMNRLKAGEPPACARACPNGAIRIVLVDTQDVRKNYQQYVNVPDAPASNYTYPTTQYKTRKQFPRDTVSADYLTVRPEHSHLPLVVMLILTQLSVGTFLAEILLRQFVESSLNHHLFPVHVYVALATGILALVSSVFHLGRPLYAFRAVLGLKTSWLSREILAFGIFAHLAILYALCLRFENVAAFMGGLFAGNVLETMGQLVFLTGIIGVLCSVMVYRDTRRPFWDNNTTTVKFLISMIILGFAMSLVISLIYTAIYYPQKTGSLMTSLGYAFALTIGGLSLGKMTIEAAIFYYLSRKDGDFLKKTAILMTRTLKKVTISRFACGVAGGLLLPLIILNVGRYAHVPFYVPVICVLMMFLLLLAGETLERYLFFRAVVPLKMPGGKIS